MTIAHTTCAACVLSATASNPAKTSDAMRRGNITALQALGKSGGGPHQRDPMRATPLMYAVAFSAMDLIPALLDNRTEL